jgi:hypothetical protein
VTDSQQHSPDSATVEALGKTSEPLEAAER